MSENRVNLASGKEFPYIIGMILSRITSKAQMTIPRAVRRILGLDAGDHVIWTIGEGGEVTVRRFALVDPADPFINNLSVFTEWADDLDEEAFRNL